MFRRLAQLEAEPFQAQQPSGQAQGQSQPSGQAQNHPSYVDQQYTYFQSLPNLIPSATSGLAFDRAIQTAAPSASGGYQRDAIAQPNEIFRRVPAMGVEEMARYCAENDVDELLLTKSATDKVGCGWVYTPPPAGSPYPVVSRGALGKVDGPSKAFDVPAYKQWFFDLQLAKKQALLDKCKALKACTDLDSEVFRGCGWCKNTNQGVPVNGGGGALYPSDPRGGCDAEALVLSRGQCPPPPPPPPGPAPMVDRTCDPVGGRLGAECIRRQVLAAGCNERGSLALALSGAPPPQDYVAGLRDSAAVKMYQRVAQPPLALDMLGSGRATVAQVLKEARQLMAQTTKPETSGLGLAARDLCLRRGTFESYDPCMELSDGAAPPFPLACLQREFLRVGGTASGKAYPSAATMNRWNGYASWGAVKAAMRTMYERMYVNTPSGPLREAFQVSGGGQAYETQRRAMSDLLGVVAERAIERVPYRQGVEVFWFVPGEPRWAEGRPPVMRGFLRRTVERDIVQLQAGASRAAQIGGPCAAMVQLMDVRAQEAASVKFRVQVDDGFWITVNQPHAVDRKAMVQVNADEPGWFENNWYQGPTWYGSKACTPFSVSTPNVVKMFFQDSGCGWNAFQVQVDACSGVSPFQKSLYSMTLEERAPFLSFEVGESGRLEERRLPAVFEQWIGEGDVTGTPYLRTDDRQTVPGQKAFLRMNSARSKVELRNIAFQSWRSLTFAVRLQSAPVRESLFTMVTSKGFVSLTLTPTGVSVDHTLGGSGSGSGSEKSVPLRGGLTVGGWWLFTVHNMGSGVDVYVQSMEEARAKRAGSVVKVLHGGPLYAANETEEPKGGSGQPKGRCQLLWSGMARHGTAAFEYDLAWVHFFDAYTTVEDGAREAAGDWRYTAMPSAYQTFRGAST